MSAIWERIANSYSYVFNDLCDDRTRDSWPSFGTLMTIMLLYLYFCKVAGPAWMKHKQPFDLTNIIFYYNIFQIIMSTYIAFAGFLVFAKYDWTCQPVIYGNTPEIRKANNLVWIYLVLKLIELSDTVFFVLRKKSRQISKLHLYHHFMMPIISFLGYKYFPNGHAMSLGVINSFVHMVMYTYYLLAGLGPQYKKILWWKKHVTIMQLVQFALISIHNLIPLLKGCSYPRWINYSLCLNSLHFVYMFGSFYYVTYIKTLSKTETSINSNKKLT